MSRTIRTTPLYPRVPATRPQRRDVRTALREQGVRL